MYFNDIISDVMVNAKLLSTFQGFTLSTNIIIISIHYLIYKIYVQKDNGLKGP